MLQKMPARRRDERALTKVIKRRQIPNDLAVYEIDERFSTHNTRAFHDDEEALGWMPLLHDDRQNSFSIHRKQQYAWRQHVQEKEIGHYSYSKHCYLVLVAVEAVSAPVECGHG